MKKFIIMLCLILSPALVHSGIYRGIEPLDSITDIKRKFQAAKIVESRPAWIDANETLCEISGTGIDGKIIICFYDYRSEYRMLSKTEPDNKKYSELANLKHDEGVEIIWVKWVPSQSISASGLISRYGNPDRYEFVANKQQCLWIKKNISANLDTDSNFCNSMNFRFTRTEQTNAWIYKHGFTPEHLSPISF